MTLNCIHILIVTGSFFVLMCHEAGHAVSVSSLSSHRCIYLRILIISYLATFLGTNSLYVLMCRKAVSQSIKQSIETIMSNKVELHFGQAYMGLFNWFELNDVLKINEVRDLCLSQDDMLVLCELQRYLYNVDGRCRDSREQAEQRRRRITQLQCQCYDWLNRWTTINSNNVWWIDGRHINLYIGLVQNSIYKIEIRFTGICRPAGVGSGACAA